MRLRISYIRLYLSYIRLPGLPDGYILDIGG
jgi:hypothetical protein